jgi:hypothetical protein
MEDQKKFFLKKINHSYAYRGFSRSTARDREVDQTPEIFLILRGWQLDSNGRKIRNWWYGCMYPHSANTPFPSPGPGGSGV